MKQAGLAFKEIRISLYQDGHDLKIRKFTPAGRVPVLIDGAITVRDSLAICEYPAARHAGKKLWPDDAAARARGRAMSAAAAETGIRPHYEQQDGA